VDNIKKEIEVSIKYVNKVETTREIWEKIDLFCPNCDKKEIWTELNNEDYYVGADHICTACGEMFTLQNGMNMDEERTPQLIKQLL